MIKHNKTTSTGIAGLVVAVASLVGIAVHPSTQMVISNGLVAVLAVAHAVLGYFAPDADKVLEEIKSEAPAAITSVDEVLQVAKKVIDKQQVSVQEMQNTVQNLNNLREMQEKLRQQIEQILVKPKQG